MENARTFPGSGARWITPLARIALITWGLVGSCSGPAPPARNVILISLDTLRADRLSCYGYERPTSPQIDEFARLGALFENAVAEAPWTLPSHASMFTGLFPATHGANLPSRRLAPDATTLAQLLAGKGFTTIGLSEGGYMARDYGFDRGFELYRDTCSDLASTLETARELLSTMDAERPHFLFLHTFEIHCPYEPPAEHEDLFRTDDEDPVATEGSCGKEFNAVRLTAGQVRAVSNRYDASIHSVDTLLGPFLRELEQSGALENTYVVITSDHGEQLYEHGRIGHERTVHRENLRVPWIVRGPGIAPRRIVATAGLVDMTPTLLELVGIEAPARMEGHSRAGWLLGHDPFPVEAEPRVSQLTWKVDLESVMTPTHQLILDRETDRATLYEFPDGVNETILEEDSFLERELRQLLDAHRAGARPPGPGSVDELDPQQVERLRSLGYGE